MSNQQHRRAALVYHAKPKPGKTKVVPTKNYNTQISPLDIFFKGFKKINIKAKNKIENQVEIDKILDKISKSGYESLSKGKRISF